MTRTHHRTLSILALAATTSMLSGMERAAATVAAHGRDAVDVWRMSGRLLAANGRAFDYAVSFFRFASPQGITVYPASVSIVDESGQRRFAERRTERNWLGLAGAAHEPVNLHVGDWSLSESASRGRGPSFDANVRIANGSLRVHGVASKPRVELGDDPERHDAYTAIASMGTIELDGERFAVSGPSWLDHEGQDAAAIRGGARLGRFRVQLDDGREIFVETSSGGNGGEARRAFLVRRDGTLETLAPTAYEFGSDGATTWRSTHTRALYPDLWALHVDGETEYLSLEPVTIDQESIAAGNGEAFWEGAVDVYDVTPGSEGLRLGSGSVLLAGYDRGTAR